MQTNEGDKAEAYLRKGALSIMPDHGDGLADLAVAMAMQAEEGGNPDKMAEAMETINKAEQSGASGLSFSKRRYVFRNQQLWRCWYPAAAAAGAAAAAAAAAAA